MSASLFRERLRARSSASDELSSDGHCGIAIRTHAASIPQAFSGKWITVFRRKCDQLKTLERVSDLNRIDPRSKP